MATAAVTRSLPQGWAYRILERLVEGLDVSCEFGLPSGEVVRFGSRPPRFRVTFRTPQALKRVFNELAVGRAYVNGEIDIEGDMLSVLALRAHLCDAVKMSWLVKFYRDLFARDVIRVNKKAIEEHYNYGDDLYLTFIDRKYRFYSHGLFRSGDETLEQASEHKLESMYEALQLQPGMRLLDIGGGWGGVTQYCGGRGVHVTAVTLATDSYNYIRNLICEKHLPGEVYQEDFLNHRPRAPYDGVVIYGVIEHLPYYRRFFTRLWECLRPGGLFYLDAAATVRKFDVSAFNRQYIWKGPHTFLCLQDLIRELLYHGLELLRVKQESRDYGLSMWHWATRLDENRQKIVERWGEKLYRAFRLYLWGGCHTFQTGVLQAYHLVARRLPEAGPRPGVFRRTLDFIQGLA